MKNQKKIQDFPFIILYIDLNSQSNLKMGDLGSAYIDAHHGKTSCLDFSQKVFLTRPAYVKYICIGNINLFIC